MVSFFIILTSKIDVLYIMEIPQVEGVSVDEGEISPSAVIEFVFKD